VIQFWWRSGSRFGSGSPKSEIRILRIGGGLWSLSISSFTMDYKQVDDGNLSPALIITVLVSTVQYIAVSHCSQNFEALRLGYGFLSITVLLHYLILVLKNCKLRFLKVLEKSLNFVLRVCYEPCIKNVCLVLISRSSLRKRWRRRTQGGTG